MMLVQLPNGYSFANHTQISFGDINFDGYPDLLAIFEKNSFRTASILVNVNGMQFVTLDLVKEIENIGNPIQASFYDFT